MATPYATEYVTLGGLMMRSRAIDCHDWYDLLGSPSKRGTDFVAMGQDGVVARPRTTGPMRGLLHVRVDGTYDQDNNFVSAASRRGNLYTLLDVVRGVVEVNTVQTLQLTTPSGTASADCVVVDGTRPVPTSPTSVKFVIDVLLPDGGLL